jgi:hypothetical protein
MVTLRIPVVLALVALAGCAWTSTSGPTGGSGASPTPTGVYSPRIVPGSFTDRISNRYFPLAAGTYVYEGTKEGVRTRDEVTVTSDRKTIIGVRCVVVHDSVFVNDKLEEETFDWYAQDADGNVWYFGEDSKELDENGKVTSTHGSWEAGVSGALPGIVMRAHPAVGDRFQQEYAKGVAEDVARVLKTDATIQVPAGSYRDVVETEDLTALDPGKVEHKFFAPGVGFVSGDKVQGGSEHTQLVRFNPRQG